MKYVEYHSSSYPGIDVDLFWSCWTCYITDIACNKSKMDELLAIRHFGELL
jgi:hypothetical protein